MNLTNTDCVGQNDLYKVVSPKNSENPKQDIEVWFIKQVITMNLII